MKEFGLKEKKILSTIADFGAANASKSLSIMAKKEAKVSISWVELFPIEKIPQTVGGPQKIITAVYLEMKNSINGCILLVFQENSAMQAADLLQGKKPGTTKNLDEMSQSALKELGNIIANSYINALSSAFKINLLDSIPYIATDMVNAILGSVLSQYAAKAENAMILKTKIMIEKQGIESQILILFHPDSYKLLMKYIKKCDLKFMAV